MHKSRPRQQQAKGAPRTSPAESLHSLLQGDTISPTLLPLAPSALAGLLPELDLGLLLHPAPTLVPIPLPRTGGSGGGAAAGRKHAKGRSQGQGQHQGPAAVDGAAAGAKRKRQANGPPAALQRATAPGGSRGHQQVVSAIARHVAGSSQAPTSTVPPSSLHALPAPTRAPHADTSAPMEDAHAADASAAHASSSASPAAAASSSIAAPASKPGRGVAGKPVTSLSVLTGGAEVQAAATPRHAQGHGKRGAPAPAPSPVTLSRTKLKHSGNDADNPITLDDSAQPSPIHNPRSAHAAYPSGPAFGGSAAAARSGGAASFRLLYPPVGSDQVLLTASDLVLLRPGEFLNDSVIDFGLKHIFQQLNPETQRKFYFFNTFFYTRWCGAEEKCTAKHVTTRTAAAASTSSKSSSSAAAASAPDGARPRCSGYAAVQKWTKGVDIFSRDFLVIPINDSLHWSVVVVCYPAKFFQPPAEGATATAATGKQRSSSAVAASNGASGAPFRPSLRTPPAAPAAPAASSPSLFSKAINGAKRWFQNISGNGHADKSKAPRLAIEQTADPFEDPSDEEEEEEEEPAQPPPKKAKKEQGGAANGHPAAKSPATAAAEDLLRVPAILYLDSLLPPPERLYDNLARYLQEEWAAKAAQAQAQLQAIKEGSTSGEPASSQRSPQLSAFASPVIPPLPASPSLSAATPPPSAANLAALEAAASRASYRWVQPPYIGGSGHRLTAKASPWMPGGIRVTQHALTDPPLYVMRVPEQQNGCDCGLYLLEYTERFCRLGERLLRRWHQATHSYAQAQTAARTGAASKVAAAAAVPKPCKFEDVFADWARNFPHSNMNKKRKTLLQIMETLAREQQHRG